MRLAKNISSFGKFFWYDNADTKGHRSSFTVTGEAEEKSYYTYLHAHILYVAAFLYM